MGTEKLPVHAMLPGYGEAALKLQTGLGCDPEVFEHTVGDELEKRITAIYRQYLESMLEKAGAKDRDKIAMKLETVRSLRWKWTRPKDHPKYVEPSFEKLVVALAAFHVDLSKPPPPSGADSLFEAVKKTVEFIDCEVLKNAASVLTTEDAAVVVAALQSRLFRVAQTSRKEDDRYRATQDVNQIARMQIQKWLKKGFEDIEAAVSRWAKAWMLFAVSVPFQSWTFR